MSSNDRVQPAEPAPSREREGALEHLQRDGALEHLRQAVGAASIGVWTYDPRSGQLVSSLGMHELVGLAYGGKDGATAVASRIHPEDVPHLRAVLSRLRCGGRVETEYRIIRPDGEVRWLMSRVEMAPDAAGRPCLRGVSWDVTERRCLEEDRRRRLADEQSARERAEGANRRKDEFLADLSHELRTPLNSILGWIDLLRGGELDREETAAALDTIERNARLQRQLIADILDVSRLIQRKVQLDRRSCEPREFVESSIQSLQPAALEKGVELRSSVAVTGPVLVDLARMQQVVCNLLSNAIEFSRSGGTVELEVVDEQDWVEVRVRDHGEGIPPEFLPHVFERFRQAEGTTMRHPGGLGLGLAIVRQLVELHGGTVAAASAGLGAGAVFSVRLPKPESERGEDALPDSRSVRPRSAAARERFASRSGVS